MDAEVLRDIVKSLDNRNEIESKAITLTKKEKEIIFGDVSLNTLDKKLRHNSVNTMMDIVVSFFTSKDKDHKNYIDIIKLYALYKILISAGVYKSAFKAGNKLISKCIKSQQYYPLFDILQNRGKFLMNRNQYKEAQTSYKDAEKYHTIYLKEMEILRDYYELGIKDPVILQESLTRVKNKVSKNYWPLFGKIKSHTFDKVFLLILIQINSLEGRNEKALQTAKQALKYFEKTNINAINKLFINLSVHYSQKVGRWDESIDLIHKGLKIQDTKKGYWAHLGYSLTKAYIHQENYQLAIESYLTYIKYYREENDDYKFKWLTLWAYIHILCAKKGITHPKLNMRKVQIDADKLKLTTKQRIYFDTLFAIQFWVSTGSPGLIEGLKMKIKTHNRILNKPENHHLKSLMLCYKLTGKEINRERFDKEYKMIMSRREEVPEAIEVMSVYGLIGVVCE